MEWLLKEKQGFEKVNCGQQWETENTLNKNIKLLKVHHHQSKEQ
jgi:hypothetical protein